MPVWGFVGIGGPAEARYAGDDPPLMSPCRNRTLLPALAGLALAALAFGQSGCASAAEARVAAVPPSTGRILTDHQMRLAAPGAILGESVYAEVNSRWLPHWYAMFRTQLFRIGLTRWDTRFDCNRFADFYSNLAQAYFSIEMFHSRTPAQALALGPFWYIRADGRGTHAVVQAVTERGRIFIDPQTGREMQLSPIEQQSGYVQLF